MSTHTHMSMKLGKLKSKNSSSGAVGGGGSLRLRLPSSLQSASSSSQTVDIALPRNSFTETDYYRATKHEIHSPVSFATLYGPRAEEDTRRATTSRIYLNRAETFDLEEEDNDAEREDYEEEDCEEGDDAEATADGKKKRAFAGAVPLASVEAGNGSSKRPRKLSSLLQTLRDSMLRKLPDRRWASLRQRRATTDTTHEQRKRAVPRSKSMPAF
ncbi:hypothetical protein HMN09_00928700 [Mycena chlorophos]|uniref:Uncharacterized protein n=1 Tax=Mycena chlorophos TaxID=658473 RepID=A0A8H6SKF8_MYCCL|nr:hypothetical protein HMN09_00928700 [Mycena chlorophos]